MKKDSLGIAHICMALALWQHYKECVNPIYMPDDSVDTILQLTFNHEIILHVYLM